LEILEDQDPRYQSQVAARPPKKLYRNYTRWKHFSDFEILNEKCKDSQFRQRKKTRKLCHLRCSEKISIVHQVVVKMMSQKMVAANFRVKPAVVMSLVKKTMGNK
jgi:hypothetical protein